MAEKIKKIKKKKGVEQLKSRYGRLFVLPWEIGLVLFFIVPLITSIIYSFSNVTLGQGGIATQWVGFEWYDFIINKDPNYLNNVKSAISNFMIQLPIIVALSLILAIILNQKFAGRMLARAIFFLPVIIATGVILDLLTSEYINVSLITSSANSSGAGNYGSSMIDFDSILGNLGLPEDITKIIGDYIGSIFNLLWSCGIQIVLFIAGLQTIPESLYEVAKVEGCTKWEEFWFITLPMLSRVIVLVVVFSCVELFTMTENPVMVQAYGALEAAQYDTGSAMLLVYFVIIGTIMAILLGILNKLCFKRWEE